MDDWVTLTVLPCTPPPSRLILHPGLKKAFSDLDKNLKDPEFRKEWERARKERLEALDGEEGFYDEL